MIQVKLPDGSVSEYPDQATALDVAERLSERLASATLGASVDGQVPATILSAVAESCG